jgi:hypothetical protein
VKRGVSVIGCCLALAACTSVNVAAQGGGAAIGGPLVVAGPLRVQGDLRVGGPATIHGPVQARALTIGGLVKTTLPRGEPPGPAGQFFATSLAVGGPLTGAGPANRGRGIDSRRTAHFRARSGIVGRRSPTKSSLCAAGRRAAAKASPLN